MRRRKGLWRLQLSSEIIRPCIESSILTIKVAVGIPRGFLPTERCFCMSTFCSMVPVSVAAMALVPSCSLMKAL